MGIWSVYVSDSEEKLLKGKIKKIAAERRWSFSQAVSGILRDHLIGEVKKWKRDVWENLTAESFLAGYIEKDAVYDDL